MFTSDRSFSSFLSQFSFSQYWAAILKIILMILVVLVTVVDSVGLLDTGNGPLQLETLAGSLKLEMIPS